MKTEFRGTKGKWTKSQISNGDIEINANGFRNLATVNFYPKGFREQYINGKITGSHAPDSSQFRTECIYNAKLLVNAPEMIELIQLINESLCNLLLDENLTDDKLREASENLLPNIQSKCAMMIKQSIMP